MTKIPKEIKQLNEDAETRVIIDLGDDRFEVYNRGGFVLETSFSDWAEVIGVPYDALKELTEHSPAAMALASLDFIALDIREEFGESPFNHQQVVMFFFYEAGKDGGAQIMSIEYEGAQATSAKPTIH